MVTSLRNLYKLLATPVECYFKFSAQSEFHLPIDMEVCYWALLFMPLVILHHLLNVFVKLANKRGFTKKKKWFPQLFVF
jgi:hypothetical protein